MATYKQLRGRLRFLLLYRSGHSESERVRAALAADPRLAMECFEQLPAMAEALTALEPEWLPVAVVGPGVAEPEQAVLHLIRCRPDLHVALVTAADDARSLAEHFRNRQVPARQVELLPALARELPNRALAVGEAVLQRAAHQQAIRRTSERLAGVRPRALDLTAEPVRRGIMESLPAGLIILNAAGFVVQINALARQMLRPTIGGEAGSLQAAEHVDALLPQWTGAGSSETEETVTILTDGNPRYLRVHSKPLGGSGDPIGTVITLQDVTEQEKAHQHVESLLTELRQADQRKDEFLAMLAHELRNPLAAIGNAVRLLERRAPEASAGRCIDILDRQTGALRGLVDDLLDVSRITRGLVELRHERVDLAAVAGRALESVQPLMNDKRHQVTATLPQEAVTMLGDPARLEQILVNLLTNAAKYTDAGGSITLVLERQGEEWVDLRVRDTGIGIEEQVRGRVFELFGQAERGLARSEGGLGIGLTIVKKLVELHGGQIEAHSEGLGKGAEFVVTLPLAPAEERVLPVATQARNGTVRPKRVLLIEDNKDIAETLALLLEDSGHEVALAHDGPSALARVEGFDADVVLIDIGLPGMDGYEVARQLRKNPKTGRAALAALTGYGQANDVERAHAAGFDRHFTKPVNIDALEAFINGVQAHARH